MCKFGLTVNYIDKSKRYSLYRGYLCKYFMKTLSLLNPEIIDTLRSQSYLAEQEGKLTAAQLDIIYKEKWFNMYVPPAYGGLGLCLPGAIQLIENLAWVDGSIGWAVTLGSGANLFIGYMDSALVSLFFNAPEACFAGSGAATGTAKPVANGYIINGKWRYATGASHATAFTANCIVLEETVAADSSVVRTGSFIFNKEEVTIEDDWNAIGMRATSSNAFWVKNLFVPEERQFFVDPAYSKLADPIFYFPFLQFAEVTLAANFSGMGIHYAEECRRLFEERIISKTLPVEQSSEILELLGRAIAGMEKNRDIFYDTLVSVWESGKEKKKWDAKLLNKLSITSKKTVKELLKIVDDLYPYCGMEGADQGSLINRIWRDLHTASQHQLVTFKQPITAC